ncbi:putative sulfate/molybdate transporter [Luteitalea sp.]|uniref:putative sulfate/molybdate transporter n=1 Tax=Luteitalea sp. TaxID=2004800 RepID=UPI0025C1A31A|nr:putative sulfate/molybdate transporter [Luteitalea sp.]
MQQSGKPVQSAPLELGDGRNRFDRMEWAGAFGDLGTLIAFVVAYISVLRMDPLGILFSFGLTMIACGAFYRAPFPVQPMKALGAVEATQAAQTAFITPAAAYGAGLATGVIWLVLGRNQFVTVDCGTPSRLAVALSPIEAANVTASCLNSVVYCRFRTNAFFAISPSVHQKVTNSLMYVKPGQDKAIGLTELTFAPFSVAYRHSP